MSTEFWLYISVCGRDGIVPGEIYRSGYGTIQFEFPYDAAVAAAAELRKRARDWADKHWDGDAGEVSAFEDLRQASGDCYTEIFKRAPRPVHDFLAEAEGEVSLIVRQQSPELSIPWGLLSQPGSEDDPRLFWAAKYNVYVNSLGVQSEDPRPRPWDFASALHDQKFDAVVPELPPAEQSFASVIHTRGTRAERFRPTLSPPAERPRYCFIYVYAHGEDGQLLFWDSQKLRNVPVCPHNLLENLTLDNGVVFIILNACDTVQAIDRLAKNLLVPRSSREIACVVTEYPINDSFALRIGLELIDRCVQGGESTLDAMKAVRQRHYPQSIAYALYCKQAFYVDPPLRLLNNDDVVNAYRQAIVRANFSSRSSP